MSNFQTIYHQYQTAASAATTPEEKSQVYSSIGISSPSRYNDLASYIPLLYRSEANDLATMTDFELLNLIPESLRIQGNRYTTRNQLVNYVKNITQNSMESLPALPNTSYTSNETSQSEPLDSSELSEYRSCLEEAAKRKSRGKLKLCPEGYCTAKMKFEVYPSAYANGYASQVCKGTQPDLEGKTENYYGTAEKPSDSGLDRWFKEKWVNVCEPGYPPCGRSKARMDKDYPYCRPMNKLPGTKVKTVGELTQEDLDKMCELKRSLPQGVSGEPTRVYLSEINK
jgi:hypothetical protein